LRQGQRIGTHIRGDDLGCAAIARDQNGESADRTAAGDEHLGSQQRRPLAGGMEADGQRLSHSGLRHRHAGWDWDCLIGLDCDALPKPTLDMRNPHRASHEAHVEALVGAPLATVPARAAWLARVDGHPHARGQVRNLAADFGDRAGDLVPKRHGLLQPDGAKAAMVKVMQIRAANASGFDADADLVRPGWHGFDLLDAEVLRSMDDNAAHGILPSPKLSLVCVRSGWMAAVLPFRARPACLHRHR
jgi:hypothetical protein